MSEPACEGLAVAMFAAETGGHLLAAPRSARFDAFVRAFDEAACLRRLAEQNVAWSRAGRPPLSGRDFARFHDPPVGLFVRGRGSADLLAAPCVAIVGARACSQYGSEVATMLAGELARADWRR